VYGSSHWFDKLLPYYACPKSPREAKAFVNGVGNSFEWVTGNMRDERFRQIDLPTYPAPGGLFPFMNDIDGLTYYWRTDPVTPTTGRSTAGCADP
jgi:hypothetical protein